MTTEFLEKTKTRSRMSENADALSAATISPAPTVVGWQGVRCVLPPDWNVVGFSMDRNNGYLRVDAPGSSTLTVQIRWINAALPQTNSTPQGYQMMATYVRGLLKRPEPPVAKPDLKATLERVLKDTAKQSKKAKSPFDSTLKAERTEGENDERTAMNFTWTGSGRGQGKIYYCSACHRILVAQVIGMAKEQAQIGQIASNLFGSLGCHDVDGWDQWALYDLEMEVPADFRLEQQKLLSGHLHLTWGRGGEKIVLDRWGLANVTLKKFTLDEWFQNNALIALKRLNRRRETSHARVSEVVEQLDVSPSSLPSSEGGGEEEPEGEELERVRYDGPTSLLTRLKMIREARGGLQRFPTRYEGGAWVDTEANKLLVLQVFHNRRTENLWEEVAERCHSR